MTADSSQSITAEVNQIERAATRKKWLTVFFGVTAFAVVVTVAYWFVNGQYQVETDDATVSGHLVPISAQTSGLVTEVLVDDTQHVSRGQVLALLDSQEAKAALAQAQSALTQAIRQARNLSGTGEAYRQAVNAREAELKLAEKALRARSNVSVEVVSAEELARAQAQVEVSRANLAAARAQFDAAHALTGATDPAQDPIVMQVAEQVKFAFAHHARSRITAPIDGIIGQRNVQIGQPVAPGQPLLSVISLQQLWVEANLKEEQLRFVRVGQPVQVYSDLYGASVKYRGRVQGLSAGTGSAFSLLPAQNATGNWVKVAQRLPVLIHLNAEDLNRYPLRLGLSMHIVIDTHDRTGDMMNLSESKSLLSLREQQKIDAEANELVNKIMRETLQEPQSLRAQPLESSRTDLQPATPAMP